MSQVKIRAALETALNAMSPALATAWENNAFEPPALTTPYQEVAILFAEPSNQEYGDNFIEQGFMQVKLNYPPQNGAATAQARGELLRTIFFRSASFTSSGVTVTIERTPEMSSGSIQNGRWVLPVKIRFFAHING